MQRITKPHAFETAPSISAMLFRYFIPVVVIVLFAACQQEASSPTEDTIYELTIPYGFPAPIIPEDNELTVARVALGKRLFYDPIISRDHSISCASCHKQALAFADDKPISPGIEGRMGFRNSPSLVNLAYLTYVNKDGGVPKLDIQALVPIEDHAEMDQSILALSDKLNSLESYREEFLRAYGDEASPFTITRALGAFQRTLISGDSPYDQFLQAKRMLSPAALAGMELFFSERTNCSQCHTGFNFTDNSFRNNGLYENYEDWGRRRVTSLMEDDGKFRVPTLRNIALTAPYMHDGSLPDLAAVIDHYQSGGSMHPNKDSLIRPLGLTLEEKDQLIQFLHTLTDSTFIHNPAFR
jgi:cytochrome c peroxidase